MSDRDPRDRGPDDRLASADRSDRIDLGAWAAPPVPTDLADRVLDRLKLASTDADGRAAIGTAAEAPRSGATRPRASWGRSVALIAGSATLAAAAAWWLTARTAGPGSEARPPVEITQTTGEVEYRNPAGHRVRVITPIATIEFGPEPVRLTVSPLTNPEEPVNRKNLALGGGAAVLLAAGISIAVHEGSARVRHGDHPVETVPTGQVLTLEPTTPAPPRLVAHATRDRGLRDQVASAIMAAQTRRATQAAARPAGTDAGLAIGPGTEAADAALPMKRDDIRKGVREVAPLLGDCYQQELLDHGFVADGKLIAHLTVETEPDLGTVVTVDDSQPTELDFPLAQAGGDARAHADALSAFQQCVDLTLESVVLPPMTSDGRLSITYPFAFAADDGSGDGSGGSGGGSDRPRTAQRDAPGPRSTAPAAPKPPVAVSPPKPPPPADPPPTKKSAEQLLAGAQAAASAGQYARALALAEQALHGTGDGVTRAKAITLAGLAACYTRNAAKARTYYDLSPPARKALLYQACRKQGIELPK